MTVDKKKKRPSQSIALKVKRAACALWLLCFAVLIAGGVRHGATVDLITYKALKVGCVIGFVTFVVVKVLVKHEEMSSG